MNANAIWARPLHGARRRLFLVTGIGAAIGLPAGPAGATPEAMHQAIAEFTGGARAQRGKVKLEVTPLVENGNAVPVTVSVDSPMTESSHVTALALFNERNPQPEVFRARLGPRAGRAAVSTRIRLATSQQLVAVARLNDGSFWSDSVEVIVTIAACIEDDNSG